MNPLQTGMYPQSQMDNTQFAIPTQMPVSREVVASDYDTQVNPYTGEMPRFDEGGHVGVKSLAKYGRHGDTMIAHISPAEADMLKAMGGSGTINPHTGLPEYWGGLGALNPVKAISNTWGSVKDIIPGGSAIDKGLVGIDKSIGKTIPGGWGTLGMIAGSAIGLPTAAMVGLGALNGSGIGHPGRKFNLQGAIMGGAMAYGAAQLGDAVRAAAGPAGDVTATQVASDIGQNVQGGVSMAPGSQASMLADQASGMGPVGAQNIASSAAYNAPAQTFGQSVSSGISNFAADRATDLSATGRGLTNLSGFGDTTASAALDAAKSTPASYTNTALPLVAGAMGLSAADQQADYEKQVNAQNSQANNAYDAQMVAIQDSQDRANKAMRAHPYQFAAGGMPPRFLSGGGDGLSDSIKATINNNQPARLADGEFVVSADVVSGLGGGSSKAGAKKLYDMMDRVRKQAHGTKKQIRPVGIKALPV